MENFDNNNFETASHNEELDFMFDKDSENFDEMILQNRELCHDFKTYFRLFRKKISAKLREKMQKNFTNIIYLTLDCPPITPNSLRQETPIDYITEMQKQYPDKDIRVLIPIINLEEDFRPLKKITLEIENIPVVLEKTAINFEFFLQNKTQNAILYRFPKSKSNVQVYGIYSPSFSCCKNPAELSKIHFLAPFIKSARIVIKKLAKEDFVPDIVHCENIPYYLGSEFEIKLPSRVKVLQIIKDFTQIDAAKVEAFWAAINLADKKGMKKICRDEVIKKCVARLFNLHNTKRFYQMKDCLKYIYKNYTKFRKYIDKGEDIDENVLFKRLNNRIAQIFPNITKEEDIYFNTMLNTLKRADFWAVYSKTYYKEIFENPKFSRRIAKVLEKTKQKSGYVSFGLKTDKFPKESTREIYQTFNLDNFREERAKNKKAILKELSMDRIKTNFVDPTIFRGENAKIVGALDTFYEAPLLFANPTSEIYANGIDILFNTILKLFELHKNIQIIICIKDGLENSFIANWVDFMSQNKSFNGRWVFIDSDINPAKFLAASDMILIPRRSNLMSTEHFLAMHYGCIPVTSNSGILNDSVFDIFEDITRGCGFKTKVSLLSEEDANEVYFNTLIKALNLYQNNPSSWKLLIRNCLSYNSGWSFKILEKYNNIYNELL